MCGRFRKKNKEMNPSAAARGCGKETAKPGRDVLAWIKDLTDLEAALEREEARAVEEREKKRQRDQVCAPAVRVLLALHHTYLSTHGRPSRTRT